MSDPFKHAYDPLGQTSQVIKCPKCGASDFDARSNQYGVHRKCRPCGNEWSGGGMGVLPDSMVTALPPHLMPDVVAELDDDPVVQYTGADFRDPGRNFGGDE